MQQQRHGIGQFADFGGREMIKEDLSRTVYLNGISRSECLASGGSCDGDVSARIALTSRLLDQAALLEFGDNSGRAGGGQATGMSQVAHPSSGRAGLAQHEKNGELGKSQAGTADEVRVEQAWKCTVEPHEAPPELVLLLIEVLHANRVAVFTCFQKQVFR